MTVLPCVNKRMNKWLLCRKHFLASWGLHWSQAPPGTLAPQQYELLAWKPDVLCLIASASATMVLPRSLGMHSAAADYCYVVLKFTGCAQQARMHYSMERQLSRSYQSLGSHGSRQHLMACHSCSSLAEAPDFVQAMPLSCYSFAL